MVKVSVRLKMVIKGNCGNDKICWVQRNHRNKKQMKYILELQMVVLRVLNKDKIIVENLYSFSSAILNKCFKFAIFFLEYSNVCLAKLFSAWDCSHCKTKSSKKCQNWMKKYKREKHYICLIESFKLLLFCTMQFSSPKQQCLFGHGCF